MNAAVRSRGFRCRVRRQIRPSVKALIRHGPDDRTNRLAIAEEAVSQAYAVTGGTDVVLVLRLRDMEEFDALCDRLFRDRTNVARFFTMMVIRTAKDNTSVPL